MFETLQHDTTVQQGTGNPLQFCEIEEYISDERDDLRPVECVQKKLQGLISSSMLPVSCLHNRRFVRGQVPVF